MRLCLRPSLAMRVVFAAVCAAVCAGLAGGALAAEAFLSRRVTLIVAFPPGGGLDNVCRVVAQGLSKRVGQPVVVENKPGAGGNIGTAAGARAAPDGSTLMCIPHSIIQGGHLYTNLTYDVVKDLAPVTWLGSVDWYFLVRADSKINSLADLIAIGKSEPGKLSIGETGTSAVLISSLLESASGANFLHVPYSGGSPALTALLGGQVDVNTQNFEIASVQIKAGKLRALAVAAGKRSSSLPDVPAAAETLPGYEASGWYGVVGSSGTPADITRRWHVEIAAALEQPEVRQRLRATGMEVAPKGPDEFGALIRAEFDKWGQVIRKHGIKAN